MSGCSLQAEGLQIMQASVATVTIVGITPYSQSRQHAEPKLEGESHDSYDERTWRHHLTLSPDKSTVIIPAHGLHQAIAAAAKYSKRQIPGQGKATWTRKFVAGIGLVSAPVLNIAPEDVKPVVISANADGIRGSGKRVTRRFPEMFPWTSTFEVFILDPIITEPVFREMLELCGMFVGVGRFRPENGGTNGRFRVDAIAWADNRRLAA
jgi:hypothetical protein